MVRLLVSPSALLGHKRCVLRPRQFSFELSYFVLSPPEMDSGVDLSVFCLLSCILGLS